MRVIYDCMCVYMFNRQEQVKLLCVYEQTLPDVFTYISRDTGIRI